MPVTARNTGRRASINRHLHSGEPQAQGCHLLSACASRQFKSHTLSENKDLTGLSHSGVPIPT